MVIPNPPEDLQVVPVVMLEEDNKNKNTNASQSSNEVDRKPLSSVTENGTERTTNGSVSVHCYSSIDTLDCIYAN